MSRPEKNLLQYEVAVLWNVRRVVSVQGVGAARAGGKTNHLRAVAGEGNPVDRLRKTLASAPRPPANRKTREVPFFAKR